MPYIIANSDGTITYTVRDGEVDTSTFSVAMVGKGFTNFGEYFAQNFLRMLENFASEQEPVSPIIGQLWYDKSASIIRVWDGSVWRAGTGIAVGPETQRPTENLSGTSFFNTTKNQLEIHDGTRYKTASYAGEITSEFSSDSSVQNPTFYGARVRTLFLKAEDNRTIPVLAFSYVKSGNSPENRGATKVGEQYETIMALYSDEDFYIRDTGAGGTATEVDGVLVDFAPELTAVANDNVTPVGIASGRRGRPAGLILKGLNTRAEYEDNTIGSFETLFANIIGTQSEPVGSITVDQLTVNDNVEFIQDVNIVGELTVAFANVTGILYASGSNSEVWANAVQPGDNVSILVNDAGYLTSADANTLLINGGYLTEQTLTTTLSISNVDDILTTSANISDLVNDANYITSGFFSGEYGVQYDSGTGVIRLGNTAVTAGEYGQANTALQITVDAQGRITSLEEFPISGAALGGNVTLNDLSVTTAAASGGGSLTYNDTNGVFTFAPADLPTDISDLTDTGNLIPTDISDLTDTGNTIPSTLLDLGISDGTAGQILSTDGNANFSFIDTPATVSVLSDLTDVSNTAPSNNQVLTWTGSVWEPGNVAAGSGDITGPGSSTNNAVVIWDGTTGDSIKDSTKLLPTGTIVGTTDTQALTNKTFQDPVRLGGGLPGTEIGIGTNSVMAFDVNSSTHMVIEGGGDVGIGFTDPQYKLHVNGVIYSNDNIIAYSDERLKENIQTLDGSKAYDMRGVSFTRKDTGEPSAGVIAQELEKVAPELVYTDSNGSKAVAYGNIVGYLIEAVKELKAEIEELKRGNA